MSVWSVKVLCNLQWEESPTLGELNITAKDAYQAAAIALRYDFVLEVHGTPEVAE